MVIIQEKNSAQKIYKLMGIPICQVDNNILHKRKNILNFIIKERFYSNFCEKEELTIKNRIIYRKTEDSDYIEYEIPQILSKRINKLKEAKKKLSKSIDKNYNKIFILRSHLGEAYVFLKFIINELIEPTDRPLIITDRQNHIELIKMFGLDIDTHLVKKYKYEINEPFFTLGHQKYYVIYGIDFYINAENRIKSTNTHYMNIIFEHFNLTKSCLSKTGINKIKISEDARKFVNDYIIRHNIGKYIFLSDTAATCKNIDETFWDNLQNRLDMTIIKNSPELSIEEAFELAKRSHLIITLRSGLSEILSETGNLHVVIYTDFRERSRFNPLNKSRVINGYSLKKISASNKNIFEIEYDKTKENQIINGIEKLINMRELIFENNLSNRW